MELGLFLMPSHPPERSPFDAHQWNLDVLSLADELGYSEAWIGEQFTAPWEPVPSPDILIAQALMRTKRIKLGTGAHLLPFHHPVELAHRSPFWTTSRRAGTCSASGREVSSRTTSSSGWIWKRASTGR